MCLELGGILARWRHQRLRQSEKQHERHKNAYSKHRYQQPEDGISQNRVHPFHQVDHLCGLVDKEDYKGNKDQNREQDSDAQPEESYASQVLLLGIGVALQDTAGLKITRPAP